MLLTKQEAKMYRNRACVRYKQLWERRFPDNHKPRGQADQKRIHLATKPDVPTTLMYLVLRPIWVIIDHGRPSGKGRSYSQLQRIKLYYQSTMKILYICFLWLAVVNSLPEQFPVIGIYTQSDQSDEPTGEVPRAKPLKGSNYTYIAASYVKYIQMSGAQVVPIFAYSDQPYFDDILPKLNGVLFPGGDVEPNINNKWTQNADYILKYAIAQNKKGNVFPVWGTCLGMQLLAYLTSGYDLKAIAPVSGQVAVKNTIKINPQSRFLGDLSDDLKYRLQNGEGILYFNHHFAVTSNYFRGNAQLREFWKVSATTTTLYSQEFLSFFEAHQYPFYGVQFHPEKNLYQWKVKADRSDSGAEIVQILSRKFVAVARKSSNRFESNDLFLKLSIYNYQPIRKSSNSFTLTYEFKEFNQVEVHKPQLQRE